MRVFTLILLVAVIGAGIYWASQKGYFGQAHEAAANNFTLHYEKGQGLFQTMAYKEAIEEFNTAINLEPNNADAPAAMVRIGDCYMEMKDAKKAEEYYKKTLDTYPNYKNRAMVEKALMKTQELGVH